MKLIITIPCVALNLIAAGILPAADQSIPTGQFMVAISSVPDAFPEISVATITTKPDGQHGMQFRDKHRNKWDVPIQFREFQSRDGSKLRAFDAYLEVKDGNGGTGVFSIRFSGRVMPDGSMEGSLIRVTSPGYQGSEREQTSIQRFTMRSVKSE